MKHALNIFENVFTKISSFEVLYDVKSRDFLFALTFRTSLDDFKEEKFLQRRLEIKNDVRNAIKLTWIKMTMFYNKKHRSTEFTRKIYIKIIKIDISSYHLSRIVFLLIKKINLFFIIRRMRDFTYELDLSLSMKIHLIIFIIHLEQAIEDKFIEFVSDTSSSIIVEEQKHWVIKKIIKSEKWNRRENFLIKWKKFEERTWKSTKHLRENVSKLMRKFENSRK